jgi:ADP-ribose pyrophosphatase YjhB (NUDIX family)
MNEINYCNNCGKNGHVFHQCKIPITSIGIIAFRVNEECKIEYLLIRRKDTLGFIDFLRGKYSLINKEYILNMLRQMTTYEKKILLEQNFDTLWNNLWGTNNLCKYKSEENISKERFNALLKGVKTNEDFYNLKTLLDEIIDEKGWDEPEWGFPKGRRNYMEKDYDCAIREFNEETGYETNLLTNINNLFPFEEIFTGSNYKSYKHKYYVANMSYEDSLDTSKFQKSEVSKMEWKTFENCKDCIRYYNLEKINLLAKVNEIINNYFLFSV